MSSLISILIPVYNVKPFLEEAVRSVLDDRLEIEVVIGDDCSIDGSYEQLIELFSDDARVKIFRNFNNEGIVSTLNKCLALSSGDFIARMDGDDVSFSDRLKAQIEFLSSNPDVDLVGVSNQFFNEHGVFKENIMPSSHLENCYSLRFRNSFSHNWMARRSVYNTLGGYHDLAPAEDYDFICRAVIAGFKVCNLPDVLMGIRFRSGNTDDTGAYEQYLASRAIASAFRNQVDKNEQYKIILPVKYKIVAGCYKISHKLRRRAASFNYFTRTFMLFVSFCLHPRSFLFFAQGALCINLKNRG